MLLKFEIVWSRIDRVLRFRNDINNTETPCRFKPQLHQSYLKKNQEIESTCQLIIQNLKTTIQFPSIFDCYIKKLKVSWWRRNCFKISYWLTISDFGRFSQVRIDVDSSDGVNRTFLLHMKIDNTTPSETKIWKHNNYFLLFIWPRTQKSIPQSTWLNQNTGRRKYWKHTHTHTHTHTHIYIYIYMITSLETNIHLVLLNLSRYVIKTSINICAMTDIFYTCSKPITILVITHTHTHTHTHTYIYIYIYIYIQFLHTHSRTYLPAFFLS